MPRSSIGSASPPQKGACSVSHPASLAAEEYARAGCFRKTIGGGEGGFIVRSGVAVTGQHSSYELCRP